MGTRFVTCEESLAHPIYRQRLPRYAVNPPVADMQGDIEAMAMYAGQGVGSITSIDPAARIIDRFAAALS
jgi:nitronate monooxygenase